MQQVLGNWKISLPLVWLNSLGYSLTDVVLCVC